MPQKIQVAAVRLDAEAQVIVINSRLCMKASKCCWIADGLRSQMDVNSDIKEIADFLDELCKALEGDE